MRHTFASLMIAAGVHATALSTDMYMGHSSVTITYDRWSHLMPGNESEAATLLTPTSNDGLSGQTAQPVAKPAS